jgi:hypothetical protein
MRAADSSPTPALHVTRRLRGPPTNSSSTPSNGGDSRGQLAAVTGVAGGPVSARGEAPLIIIGSTAHVRVVHLAAGAGFPLCLQLLCGHTSNNNNVVN